MNLSEYSQLALLTTIYPNKGNNIAYAALGLAGESGEVAGKIATLIDTKQLPTEEQKHEICKELGDILWYVNAVCFETGIELTHTWQYQNNAFQNLMQTVEIDESVLWNEIARLYLELNGSCGRVAERTKKLIRDKNGIVTPEFRDIVEKDIQLVLRYLDQCGIVFGITLESVAYHNIYKLVDRGLRNKLKGEGDNR